MLPSFFAQLTRDEIGEDPITSRPNHWLGTRPYAFPTEAELVAAIAPLVGVDEATVRAAMEGRLSLPDDDDE